MKSAVVFLTATPSTETILFAELVGQATDMDAYIVIDNESAYNNSLFKKSMLYETIEIRDEICKDSGYIGTNIDGRSTHIRRKVIAWDKMLYNFCNIDTDYDFVWVFEDDVFIPSYMNIVNLHKKYSQFDLVVPAHRQKTDKIPDWHWPHIFKSIAPPHFTSMVCAVGLSRNMLNAVEQYALRNRKLFHVEALFNTLAAHNMLLVCPAKELKSIVWKAEWRLDHFMLLPDNLWHPKKDIENFNYYRNEIRWLTMSGYKPTNTGLPDFLKE